MIKARLARVAFRTSRLLDFIGERELTAQIGHPADMWPLVVLKELLDNALDAAEEAQIAPAVRIEVVTEPGKAGITIADDGPGIPAETISDILDYSTRTSSREAYCSPCRGSQGNGLKILIAMPYALSGGTFGETVIESHGVVHRISFRADAVRQEPRIEHHREPAGVVVKNGTSITVLWPDSARSYLDGRKHDFLQIAFNYVVLNPHLALEVRWDGEQPITWGEASDESWHPFRACDPTSAYWYDVPRLAGYAAAHVARDQDRGKTRTVRDFIAEFRGLSGSAKQKLVLEQSGLIRQPLAALFDDGAVNTQYFKALLEAMCDHSRPIKARDLGIIGEAYLREFCATIGADDDTFRYRTITGETIDDIPFVVEAAFAAAEDSDESRRLVLGVNFAAKLGNPFRTFSHSYEGLESRLAEQRCGSEEPVVVILHLAQARIEYQDRGKSAVVLDPAISSTIVTALESVTGKWAKQRKAEERDHSRRMRRREQLVDKPVRVSIKDAAWEVMRAAYLKASDNGQLPAKPRQIMYAARPAILVRGLPVEGRPIAASATAFWGIGTYFGSARSQNAQGHLLGHVYDLGKGLSATNPNLRSYATAERQNFHIDRCDVVALLCLQRAKSGGRSSIVSSMAVHNVIAARRPDLLDRLYQPFPIDRRGEVPEGKARFYEAPVFNKHEGYVSVLYSRLHIGSSQRFPEVQRLTAEDIEALDMLAELAADPELRLDMNFMPGDIQFLHNHTILHARSAYEDWPEIEHKRHLLRLWLSPPGARPLPPVFAECYGGVTIGDRGGIICKGTRLHAPLTPG